MEGVGRGREEEEWKERRESRDGRSEGRAGNERRVEEGWKEIGKFRKGSRKGRGGMEEVR
jgi:hypothetical protein